MRYLKTVTIIIIKYSHIQQKNASPNIKAENYNFLIHTLYLLSNECSNLQIFKQFNIYFHTFNPKTQSEKIYFT